MLRWIKNYNNPFGESYSKYVFPLRLLSLSSIVIAVLNLLTSSYYLVDLYQTNESGYSNSTISDDCDSQYPTEPSHCEFLKNWNTCVVLAIIITSVQICYFIISFCFWKIGLKTNIWCAIHSSVFIVLCPAVILTWSNQRNAPDEDLLTFKGTLFLITSSIDFSFSIVATIIVFLNYGYEIIPLYQRLDSGRSNSMSTAHR